MPQVTEGSHGEHVGRALLLRSAGAADGVRLQFAGCCTRRLPYCLLLERRLAGRIGRPWRARRLRRPGGSCSKHTPPRPTTGRSTWRWRWWRSAGHLAASSAGTTRRRSCSLRPHLHSSPNTASSVRWTFGTFPAYAAAVHVIVGDLSGFSAGGGRPGRSVQLHDRAKRLSQRRAFRRCPSPTGTAAGVGGRVVRAAHLQAASRPAGPDRADRRLAQTANDLRPRARARPDPSGWP